MKMSFAPSLLIIFFAVGCSHPVAHWEKDNDQGSLMEHDKRDYEYQARLATASADVQASPSIGTTIGEGINIAEKQIDLVNDCMRSRGYHPG